MVQDKPRKEEAKAKSPPSPPIRPTRGGFLCPFGLGQFIRAYLSGDERFGPAVNDPDRGAPTEDIRFACNSTLLLEYAEDMVATAMEQGKELTLEQALLRTPRRLTKIRGHSLYR